ncbi:hypothetical protein JTB14_015328 [Gonioctena quinquepunctata]|nr:hypothetical protein JTB14_015328 [Gonioctena quinquepunctata]
MRDKNNIANKERKQIESVNRIAKSSEDGEEPVLCDLADEDVSREEDTKNLSNRRQASVDCVPNVGAQKLFRIP